LTLDHLAVMPLLGSPIYCSRPTGPAKAIATPVVFPTIAQFGRFKTNMLIHVHLHSSARLFGLI
jgi:hypothetical protein